MKPRIFSAARRSILFSSIVFTCVSSSALAATYLWDGTTNLWTSAHWDAGAGLVAGPTGASNADSATINAGTVTFSGVDTFGNAGITTSPVVTINSGGTLASGGFFNTIWNLNLNGGTLLANGGSAAVYPAFQLAGTVTVGGTQMSTIDKTAAANSQINIGGNGNQTLTFNVADVTGNANPDLTINATLQNNIFGPATSAGSLTKTGAGTLTLTGANTYTGTTTVSAGTLNVTGSYTPGVTTGSVFVANGGSLTFAMGAGTANFYGDGFGNSMQIGEASTGTLTLQSGTVNVNTLTGGSTASLRLGGYVGGNGTIVVNGGALNVPGRILIAANGNAASSGTLTINGGAVNMGTVGSGSYTDPGSGVLWFGGGTTTVNLNGGTLALFSLYNQGGGAVTVNLNGGTLKAIANNTTFVNGALTMKVQAGGAVIDTSTFGITIATALVHDAALGATPDGGLAKNGTGTLTLTAANTYTGVTNINAGNLIISGAGVIANNASNTITIGNGGTLTMDRDDTWGGSFGATPLIPIVINAGGTMTNSGGRFNMLGPLTLNGGTLTSTGGNGAIGGLFDSWALTGTVTVGGSSVSTISQAGTTANINLGSSATAGTIFSVADATGNSAVDLTVSAVLQNGGNSANAAQASFLTKSGLGTMTLSGTNTYTGATNVTGGTLVINGSISTSILTTVSSGATLAGTGTVGAATIQGGATLSPGVSGVGILSTGNYSQAGTLTLDLNGLSNYDQVNVTGSVTLSGLLSASVGGGYTPANGNLLFILLNDGSDAISGTFSGLAQNGTVTIGTSTFQISYNADSATNAFSTVSGNDIALLAIPEPNVAALIGGFGVLALLRRRR